MSDDLEIGAISPLIFSGNLDFQGDMRVVLELDGDEGDFETYIDLEDAVALIAHLQKHFDLVEDSE